MKYRECKTVTPVRLKESAKETATEAAKGETICRRLKKKKKKKITIKKARGKKASRVWIGLILQNNPR